jgi:RNA polymerase sigma-70 factor (ECF subfamily)
MKRHDVPFGEHHQISPQQLTSPSLLVRLRAGDQQGWQRLVRLYGPLVYSWCRRAGLPQDDASDAVQDVFFAVSKNLDKFRNDRPGDSFRKWLKTVAYNRVRDYQRRGAGKAKATGGTTANLQMAAQPAPVAVEVEETDIERAAETDQLLRQATELVRSDFEEKTWQSFWQTAVEGRKTADVAADLGITANAVRIAKSRVRARLREELDGLME